MIIHTVRTSLIACLLLFSTFACAAEFLEMTEAFKGEISVNNGAIHTEWHIAPKYYLYQKSLDIKIESAEGIELGDVQFTPEGKLKVDEFMGEVVIHHDTVTVSRPYTLTQSQDVTIIATYQGCAEDGLCYPPSRIKRTLSLAPNLTSDTTQGSGTTKNIAPSHDELNDLDMRPLWQNLLIFFGLGLLLSMTPCVLPMIPILGSLIIGSDQTNVSARRGFALSTSYVLGMATVYTFVGLAVALSGARLQVYMQHPYVLWPLASLFVILAISLFGAFELKLPSAIHNRLYQIQSNIAGGEWVGVFFIGALSALVVSPCVSAPLAGILLYVAQDGDVVTGSLSLLSLALGMGAPLIVLGTTGANILPKAGMWMNNVKTIFGFLMLAMALYLVKHLMPLPVLLGAIAFLCAFMGAWLGALNMETKNTNFISFHRGLGLCLLFLAAALTFKAVNGANQEPRISHAPSHKTTIVRVTNITELEKELAAARQLSKPVMIDVYADWCVACLEFEAKTFPHPDVAPLLAQFHLIKLDITDAEDVDQTLNALKVIGPPTLIFYDDHGQPLEHLRVTGFMDGPDFSEVLQQAL